MSLISFIIPVYNTEKYLSKCLDSIVNQSINEFEIIIINDGSTDNSQIIIEQYKNKFPKIIKTIIKENEGLSCARNDGVKIAQGKYIYFVDSDDYIANDFVKKIKEIDNKKLNIDLIRVGYAEVYNDKIENITSSIKDNDLLTGAEYFKQSVFNKSPFEMACLYLYNKDYWLENNYHYSAGMYHEDFGLTPLVILKSENIYHIKDILYFYVQTDNSITRNNNYKKTIKKAEDLLKHYDGLLYEVDKINLDINQKKIFLSYISNALILKALELKGRDLTKYIKELTKRRVFDNILSDTLIRKIKKVLLKISPKIFIKVIK